MEKKYDKYRIHIPKKDVGLVKSVAKDLSLIHEIPYEEAWAVACDYYAKKNGIIIEKGVFKNGKVVCNG